MGALCLFLAAACGYDYSQNKIPNYIILFIGILGVLENIPQGFAGICLYLMIAGLVMALVYPLYKIGCLGAGDVKLLGMTAGFLPFKKILVFLFVSLLISSVISLIKMFRRDMFWERLRYLFAYFSDVLRKGYFKLYFEKQEERDGVSVCLSGPVFISILLYLGGAY